MTTQTTPGPMEKFCIEYLFPIDKDFTPAEVQAFARQQDEKQAALIAALTETLKHDYLIHSHDGAPDGYEMRECGRCQWVTLPARAALEGVRR